jgi:hypothetical protein
MIFIFKRRDVIGATPRNVRIRCVIAFRPIPVLPNSHFAQFPFRPFPISPNSSQFFPVVVALLPDKQEQTYRRFIRIMCNEAANRQPQVVHCDYEMAVFNTTVETSRSLSRNNTTGTTHSWSAYYALISMLIKHTCLKTGHCLVLLIGMSSVQSIEPSICVKDFIGLWRSCLSSSSFHLSTDWSVPGHRSSKWTQHCTADNGSCTKEKASQIRCCQRSYSASG